MDSEFPEQAPGGPQPRPIIDEVLQMRERLSRMESIIQQAVSLAAVEARRADEIQESFEAPTAALAAQLQKKEDSPQKESGFPEPDQGLAARIQDLENQLREKEDFLGLRETELKDLQAKVEEMAASAAEAQRAQEGQGHFEATVESLKAELGKKEELLSQKDIALKEMEESLTGLEESLVNQIRLLEDQLEEMVQKSGSTAAQPAEKKKISGRSPKRS